MPTSVYLPKPLLDAVDKRARAMKVSRNRLIVRALERELSDDRDWSPHFFQRLEQTSAASATAVEQMLIHIRQSRRSKSAPRL
jgi:metal-responsive CopG/Arc/MetJ family transcriptional regulator